MRVDHYPRLAVMVVRVVNARLLWLLCLSALVSAGCSQEESGNSGGMPPVQVVALAAKKAPIADSLSLVGTLAANEMVEMRPEIEGTVQRIHFKEGDLVEEGDLLVELDSRKLDAAVAEAEARYELSRITFERNKELMEGSLVSPQEFDQASADFALNEATLQLKKQQLQDTEIRAPFSGMVGARQISPGQVVIPSTVLTWLVDLDPVKVEFHVPERFLSQTRTNQLIEMSLASYSDERFEGRVFFVSPYVDPGTRTALVKAVVPNPDHRLKPGMFASLDLTLQVKEAAILIPEVALSQLKPDDRANVLVVDAENTIQLRPVRLGLRLPGRVEVLEGLRAGELVVVEGVQKVGPGSNVRLAPKEAAEPYQWND